MQIKIDKIKVNIDKIKVNIDKIKVKLKLNLKYVLLYINIVKY